MKKYQFIGNVKDITPCEYMGHCNVMGCRGRINGECCFDKYGELLSIGSDYYEEVRDTVFRVEKDGLQSSGGLNPLFDTKGKIWMKASHLKNHFKQSTGYNHETKQSISLYKEYPYDAEVVEYALVEVKRTPVCEFLGVKCDEDYSYI